MDAVMSALNMKYVKHMLAHMLAPMLAPKKMCHLRGLFALNIVAFNDWEQTDIRTPLISPVSWFSVKKDTSLSDTGPRVLTTLQLVLKREVRVSCTQTASKCQVTSRKKPGCRGDKRASRHLGLSSRRG